MLIALPQALTNLKELARRKRAGTEFTLEFLDAFLNALAVLGIDRHTIYMLRRNFELVGSLTQNASDEIDKFKDRLDETDRALGVELGGLGNLFCSLMEEQEVFTGANIDFDGLGPSLQSELAPLRRAYQQILAANDISVAAQAAVHRVAACVCLATIEDWISTSAVSDLLGESTHLKEIANLYRFRSKLDDLRPEFIQNTLPQEHVRDFALWYLAYYLTSGEEAQPLERRLIATLLNRAVLPKLDSIEQVFRQ